METQRSADLGRHLHRVRTTTIELTAPLSAEDMMVQSMEDVSPTKWHLAHTTWFFETFILAELPDYQPHNPQFQYLYNSYYNAVGEQYPRARRGLITRPGLSEILDYRSRVDEALDQAIEREWLDEQAQSIARLGLNHEQQHQELMLMDIQHVLWHNPLRPVYLAGEADQETTPAMQWHAYSGGRHTVGHQGNGFAYDNEGPPHDILLRDFELAGRLVTQGEYLEFMRDGGYSDPTLWLSDGWSWLCQNQIQAPLYWFKSDQEWQVFGLQGARALNPAVPVSHVSLYEADAFASWAGYRLPREHELEVALGQSPAQGNFQEDRHFVARPASDGEDMQQLWGDLWEWTSSAYQPYPGFKPAAGALGEYNGKFMCNQMVMRGGACVTPADHLRATYRNFFYPHMRWQFGGIRLAR